MYFIKHLLGVRYGTTAVETGRQHDVMGRGVGKGWRCSFKSDAIEQSPEGGHRGGAKALREERILAGGKYQEEASLAALWVYCEGGMRCEHQLLSVKGLQTAWEDWLTRSPRDEGSPGSHQGWAGPSRSSTGTPQLIALRFTELHTCCTILTN